MACGQLVDGGLAEHVERHVDEVHRSGLRHVAHERQLIAAVIRGRGERGVRQAHEIIQILAHVLRVELLRRDAVFDDLPARVDAGLRAGLGRLGVILALVLDAQQQIEARRWLAHCDSADTVHDRHLPGLERAQLLNRLAGLMGVAQFGGEFAQLRVQVLLERRGIAGVRRLRVGLLRHQTVLLDQRDEHLPPAAIVSRAFVDRLEDAAVRGLVERLEHVLKVEVRLLQLVVEEQIAFGELEIVEVPLVHQLVAQRVQRCEHPAAAGMLLRGDRPLLEFDRERAGELAHAAIRGRGLENAVRYRRVRRHEVRAVRVERRGVFPELFRSQCQVVGLVGSHVHDPFLLSE